MTDPVRRADPLCKLHSDLLRPISSLCLCVSVVNLFILFGTNSGFSLVACYVRTRAGMILLAVRFESSIANSSDRERYICEGLLPSL